jgi:tetratricopeptide (TPR) repeat protein
LKITRILYFAFLVVVAFSCSTEKNTTVTRTYHKVTAKYNAFFNGHESLKEGVEKINNSFKDDYTHTIPVFRYGDIDVCQSASPEMDRAIEKAIKVIENHSITAKPKSLLKKIDENKKLTEKEKEFYKQSEYNPWIRSSYLMMGKAHFYKHEYPMALKTFRYILREFETDEIKYKANIWIIRTDNERGEFKEAGDLLKKVTTKFKEYIDADYYTTYADYHLKQKDYEQAKEYLNKALDSKITRDQKIRYYFILAQINQELGNLKKASDFYDEVIKKNPPYEMAFNAKINQAMCFRKEFGNISKVKNQLYKMLKDDKNIEFQDQIYYALGNIEYKAGNKNEAIKLYKKSARASVGNNIQKTTSYISIADIYYQQKSYRKAGVYYDSARYYITDKYPDYDVIMEETESLINLVDYLNTIELQDSLQRLAKLSESERLKIIDKSIAEYKKREKEKKEQQRLMNQNRYYMENRLSQERQQQSGNWYFYNPSMVKMGKNEFAAKWGNRSLEDNWRRKNKSVQLEDELASESGDTAQTEQKKELKKTSREYYLQFIPLTDSAMEVSHRKMQDALFNAARIYQDELNDYKQAIKLYQELAERYPDSDLTLMAYYQLYEMHNALGNTSDANKYKSIILSKFPDSIYAKVLKDPSYLDKLQQQQDAASRFYETTYEKYKAGRYTEVIEAAKQAFDKYKKRKDLVRKFNYLKVLSIGKSKSIRLFEQELKSYIEAYSGTEEADQAQDILTYLYQKYPSFKQEEIKQEAAKIYSVNNNANHYFVLVTENEADVNQMVFNLINFNVDNYKKQNINVTGESLGEQKQMAIAKSFNNKTEAMEYYNNVSSNAQQTFKDLKGQDYQYFVITKENYRIFFEDKSTAKYMEFFKSHYLR